MKLVNEWGDRAKGDEGGELGHKQISRNMPWANLGPRAKTQEERTGKTQDQVNKSWRSNLRRSLELVVWDEVESRKWSFARSGLRHVKIVKLFWISSLWDSSLENLNLKKIENTTPTPKVIEHFQVVSRSLMGSLMAEIQNMPNGFSTRHQDSKQKLKFTPLEISC